MPWSGATDPRLGMNGKWTTRVVGGHMGSFGPMRLVTGSPDYIRPAPFQFGPNPDTLLGTTDMVFIDAPGSGLSRPLGDAKPTDFYGVDQDADAFARAVLRYVTKYNRWNSPKFLFGESYGTTRSGALLPVAGSRSGAQRRHAAVLDHELWQPPAGARPGLSELPAELRDDGLVPSQDGQSACDRGPGGGRARAYAVGPYAAALAKGQNISPEERDQVAQRLSALTGLSADFLRRSNLRVDLSASARS
jgi:hypothetical protein